MIKNIKKHFLHYLVYLIIFGGGLVLILLTSGNSSLEALSILSVACFYFMWSIFHHHVHHRLHPQIVVEYGLIVLLGMILVLFLFGV
jgi:hypothetical protein